MDKRVVAIAFLAGYTTCGILSSFVVKSQDKKIDRLVRKNSILFRTVQSFTKHTTIEVMEAVKQEVEFDWIVMDIKD